MKSLDEAYSRLKEGWFEEAAELFTTSLSSTPGESKAWCGRGMANFQLKKWEAAIADFTKARELNPEEGEAWFGLGMSLAMTLQIYPAIDALETLLAKKPDFNRARIQLGLLYFRLCIPAKGRRHLETALSQRPSLAERQIIEKALRGEERLDKKRLYRPDFEALKKEKGEVVYGSH